MSLILFWYAPFVGACVVDTEVNAAAVMEVMSGRSVPAAPDHDLSVY